MMPKRLVIDTNVLVSAALASHSVPARVLLHAFDVASILTSDETLLELVTVLSRKKFDRYVSVERRETFVKKFHNAAVPIFVGDWTPVCRDPKDDKFLALAVAGMADFLITGDQDLLALHPFQKVAIVTPQAFLVLQTT